MDALREIAALSSDDNNFSVHWCAEALLHRSEELLHDYQVLLRGLLVRRYGDGHRKRWPHSCCEEAFSRE